MATKKERAEIDLIINGQSANANLRDLEAAARKAKAELRGMMPGTPEFNKMAQNLANIDKQLQKTRVEAGLTQSKWAKMKQEIKTTFIGNLGANLATLGLQQVASYFTDAWDSAKKLSDQMADIAKTTGMSVDEVKALNTELGKIDTRTSMSDLREIAKIGGQFGVAKEELLGFVEAVDRTTIALGDEFSGGAEEVAAEMSKLRNILIDIKSNDIGTDIGFISNAINELAAAGVATGPVVSDLANRIGGYGAQIGLSSGQILGLSATLQELGVTAERGGTAVVKILQKMLTNSQEFATIAGMELGEFETLLNQDLFGAFTKVMEGSKKMGGSSTLLAAIIKDLEVSGAGASEVFAKLGGNTEMLSQKVNLASDALTNTNSITEEARLRNENFAGSVERLSKAWSKLTSNPAVVAFFKGIVDFTTSAIDGMSSLARVVAYNYDVITKGKAEADRIYLEESNKILQEQLNTENASMGQRIAGHKNALKQMTVNELQEQLAKAKTMYKADMDYAKKMLAEGSLSQQQKAIERAKETALEVKAAEEILQLKQNSGSKTLEQKRQLTEKELKLQEAANKEAEKIAKENAEKELKIFQDQMYAQIDALKELAALEKEVAGGDDIEAELARLEALQKEWDGFANDIADYNREKAVKTAEDLQNIGYAMMDTINSVQNLMAARDQNDLVRFKSTQDEKMRKLEEQREKGIITEEQYQLKRTQLEQQTIEKENEMRRKQARQQKAMAIFDSALQAAMAWVKAYANAFNPVFVAAAVAATAQAGIVAAMPLPEFEQGGFTGKGLNQEYNGKKIAGVVHPNEFVINSSQLKNPFVYNFAKQLATDKTGSSIGASNSTSSMAPQVVVKSDPELIALLTELKNNGVKGVWDWDYEQRTKARMAELDNRRKM